MTRDCVDPWKYVEFRVNGDIAPCCVRKGVGNLASEALATILNGEPIRALRASLLGGALDRVCWNCTMRAPTTPAALTDRVSQLLAEVAVPGGFEPATYLQANPDVARQNIDPSKHFLDHGRFEGRRLRPGPRSVPLTLEFDPDAYLLTNPDVARAGQDPREHFLRQGQYEGRPYGQYKGRRLVPGPRSAPMTIQFDPESYLLMNQDVARADQDPQEHFLRHGLYEGRKLRPEVTTE
jgi:Iron-sulfur cluster-binding domain